MSFETAVEQWREGERRLAEAPPEQQAALERVTARIEAELRRRLGGAFTAEELAELYDEGHRLVHRPRRRRRARRTRTRGTPASSPTPPSRRYLRRAADFAGGRRRIVLVAAGARVNEWRTHTVRKPSRS